VKHSDWAYYSNRNLASVDGMRKKTSSSVLDLVLAPPLIDLRMRFYVSATKYD